MEEVMTRPKQQVLTLPYTRKLTAEELDDLLDNWEYDPHRFDDEDMDDFAELSPVYDQYGNPTVETMDAMYESRHDIGEETTLDEMLAWIESL